MIEYINIKELCEALAVKDIRTALRWAKSKALHILKVGKQTLIPKLQFEYAFHLPLIKQLKAKFGTGWNDVFNAFLEGDMEVYASLVENDLPVSKPKSKKVPSKAQQAIINKLLDL